MTTQMASHGRGGAGNMAKSDGSPKITPADLETPTLKKPVVTTGRGGTGNMAKNKDPIETRLRQDVEAYVPSILALCHNTTHYAPRTTRPLGPRPSPLASQGHGVGGA